MKVTLIFWIAPTHVEFEFLYITYNRILLYRNMFELVDVVLRPYCCRLSKDLVSGMAIFSPSLRRPRFGDGLCGQRHGLAMNWADRPRTSADERMLSGHRAVVIV